MIPKKNNLQNKLKRIKLIASDVDGVLTDGKIRLVGDEELKVFNGKEAMKIEMLIRSGIPLVWVTGRKCAAVTRRSKELGVDLLFKKDLQEKGISLPKELEKTYKVKPEEVMYVGDDWGDLFLMQQFGLSATPNDGSIENRKIAKIVTKANGGEGVLAELIEVVMKAQKTWNKYLDEYTAHFLY
jgi:3-deoxy-D-manno-octulosonate 8-phosphate phosphatase (KDO 8-P phosphatase)